VPEMDSHQCTSGSRQGRDGGLTLKLMLMKEYIKFTMSEKGACRFAAS